MTPEPVEITAAGCALRAQLWPGDPAWILLLHDVGPDEDLDRWLPLIPALLAEHFSILAVDLRGHGASDGDWCDDTSADDITAIVRFVRAREPEMVVAISAGASAFDAIRAAGEEEVDGIVSLSATLLPETSPLPRKGRAPSGWRSGVRADLPRAPGTPKLFLVGAHDTAARETTAALRAASIGWALVVTYPTQDHGTELLAGTWASYAREQILGFIRERRYLARSSVRESW